MLGWDNYILSSYYLCSSYSSSCVINDSARKCDESSERCMLSLCASTYVCVYMFTISWCLCTFKQWICLFVSVSIRVSLIKSQISRYQLFLIFSFCAGTLSVCVGEKLGDSALHSGALQFLSAVFTEEIKGQGVEVTTSNPDYTSALSDVLNGPSASQLCELLLQVRGDGGGHIAVRQHPGIPILKITEKCS